MEKIKGKLFHYLNEPEAFLQAIKETLEAEVRSKFQTMKQMEFTEQGNLVGVLFDETIVRYRWVSERQFEIMEVVLKYMDKTLLETQQILNDESEAYDETMVDVEVSDEEKEKEPIAA